MVGETTGRFEPPLRELPRSVPVEDRTPEREDSKYRRIYYTYYSHTHVYIHRMIIYYACVHISTLPHQTLRIRPTSTQMPGTCICGFPTFSLFCSLVSMSPFDNLSRGALFTCHGPQIQCLGMTRGYTLISVTKAGVCDKNTPPEKGTGRTIRLQSTKSEAGEQFLLLDCRAEARVKNMFFTDTGIYKRAQRCECHSASMLTSGGWASQHFCRRRSTVNPQTTDPQTKSL